jgi:hypothetical protein
VEHGGDEPWPVEVREIRGTRYFTLGGGWCWLETPNA